MFLGILFICLIVALGYELFVTKRPVSQDDDEVLFFDATSTAPREPESRIGERGKVIYADEYYEIL